MGKWMVTKTKRFPSIKACWSGSIFTGLIALALFSLSSASHAESKAATIGFGDTPMANIYARETTDLSGKWRYILDPLNNAIRKPNYRRNFWEDRKQEVNGKLIEYDWATADFIKVPSDWNSAVPQLDFYEGVMWYQRTIDVKPQPGRRYFLYFEGADYLSHVWLNKTALGKHEGGFTPFSYEVTDILKKGENLLVVAVNNHHDGETVPTVSFDWWNYGGITRPVHLASVPGTYIHDYRLHYESINDQHHIEGRILLKGPGAANTNINLVIKELGLDVKLNTDDQGMAHFSLLVPKLTLWSPERPKLYKAEIISANDRLTEEIGFRHIEVKGKDILLNGKSIYLKGISIHEEPIAAVGTRTMDWKSAELLLKEAKELGSNFVRLAHYPHTEKMTRLADRLGLLVWSEIPVYWDVAFDNKDTLALAKNMLHEMISRDYNRASIVVWGVANETPINDQRNRFLRNLIEQVRAEDSTRLVSAALKTDKSETGNIISVSDPLGQDLDIVAVNEYEGWYGSRTLKEIADLEWRSNYDKPMIFSEFGAGALYGYHDKPEVRWSEEYQRVFYEETVKMARKIEFLRGMSPWILKDFRSPRRFHSGYQQFWNRKGLISETGKRKQAYFALQKDYKKGFVLPAAK